MFNRLFRREKLEVDNEALDAEFNQTLSALTMQGVDLNKIRGGRQGQQRVAQAVAMESANRVLTRRALDTLKSIAVGEYVPPEERQKAVESESDDESKVTEAAAETTETEVKVAEAETETVPDKNVEDASDAAESKPE